MVIMVPAADFHRGSIQPPVPRGTRDEVIARYRHLRAISKRHNNQILKLASTSAMLHQARRLGVSDGKRLILGSMSELDLVCDLLVYAAPPGRSRALDRYARNSPPPAGSDEALMLAAMARAHFAVLTMGRRHPAAGVIFNDLFRDEEIWLVDEGLEASLQMGMACVARYYTPEQFSMTTGVVVPIDRDFLIEVIETYAPQLGRKPKHQAIADPRFAEAVYRAAIAEGIMERVEHRDPPAEGYAA